MMAVCPRLDKPKGLIASRQAGRALGPIDRAAINPSQLEPIWQGSRPEPEELEHARAVPERVFQAEAVGEADVVLPDGAFLDASMVEAEVVLALANLITPPRRRDLEAGLRRSHVLPTNPRASQIRCHLSMQQTPRHGQLNRRSR